MTYKELEEVYASIDVKRAYTADEICTLLGVSMSSVQRWARSGRLKRLKNRMGMTFYIGEDVKAFCYDHMLAMRDDSSAIVELDKD